MKNLSYHINKYCLNLLDKLEKTNDQKLLLDFASELKFNILFKVLNEKLFITALEHGKMINSFFGIKNISRDPSLRIRPDYFLQSGTSNDENTQKEIIPYPLHKGILIRILEIMKLEETRRVYIKQLIIDDPEINERLYLSEDEISNFDRDLFEITLKKELKEKYRDKPIVINLGDIRNEKEKT